VRANDEKVREEQEQEQEQSEAHAEALREELGDRFRRALEAERINTERGVRLELEREGRNAVPETVAAPFSGNISPAHDPHAGTVRIGGRIVDV
jgi:vacuolar-type H+-ATPase subunit E/Vma4